eukprot:1130765-Prymnesium_polylepis.1
MATTRAPRAFEAADTTCEQAAKEGTQIGARSKEHGTCEARCAKEISATVRPNGIFQSSPWWQRARRRCARSTCRAGRKESDENGAV